MQYLTSVGWILIAVLMLLLLISLVTLIRPKQKKRFRKIILLLVTSFMIIFFATLIVFSATEFEYVISYNVETITFSQFINRWFSEYFSWLNNLVFNSNSTMDIPDIEVIIYG